LQCLANIPCLRDYFVTDAYRDTLKVSGKLTETTNGELAEGFAVLLRRLWRPAAGGEAGRALAPWDFRQLVCRYDSRFIGYRQHDSMEFIEYLIDALKEDCNRVKGKKLYVERADSNNRPDAVVALEASNKFLLRNDSVIDDYFVGFLKATTTCPEPSCQFESVVFDPILSVKVPLQSSKQCSTSTFAVTVVPVASSGRCATRHHVSLPKFGSVGDLLEAAAQASGIRPESAMLIEVFSSRVYKFFEAADQLVDIDSADILVMYELAHPEAFEMSNQKRWGPGEVVKEGDVVQVVSTFSSCSGAQDDKGMHECSKGLLGRVLAIDHDGDASVRFDGHPYPLWVLQDNFGLLQTDIAADSREPRTCPHDGRAYTLHGLIDEWGHEYSLRDLRLYWRDVMKPVQVRDPPPRSGVILHFRHYGQYGAARRRELFGIPAVFTILRESTTEELAKAVHAHLSRLFGDDCTGWSLFKADNRSEVQGQADELLWEDGEAQGPSTGDRWLREREYLVVEWREVPGPVARAMAAVDPQAEDERDTAAQAVPLETCFEWMMEREQLSEHDAAYCSQCKEHRQMFKKLDLWSLPPVLVLQLKRFGDDQRQRLATAVSFPLEGLDMRNLRRSSGAPFPEGACVRAGQQVRIRGLQSAAGRTLNGREGTAMYLDSSSGRFCVRLQADDPPAEWKRCKPDNVEPVPGAEVEAELPALFDLAAVSKHVGGTRYGHYVAYARSGVDGKWRLFDDEYVTEVPAEEVEAERVGAYVLFYLRRDHRPEAWGQPA